MFFGPLPLKAQLCKPLTLLSSRFFVIFRGTPFFSCIANYYYCSTWYSCMETTHYSYLYSMWYNMWVVSSIRAMFFFTPTYLQKVVKSDHFVSILLSVQN